MLYFSLIPSSGSRIALCKDKQLELAHVVIYSIGTIHPTRTFRLRIFLHFDLRDLTIEDNVRKRPITKMSCPIALSD